MANIFAQGLAAFMLIFFGLLALYPLFLSGDTNPAPAPRPLQDDVVLHIQPAPAFEGRVLPGGNQPFPLGQSTIDGDSSHRPAA